MLESERLTVCFLVYDVGTVSVVVIGDNGTDVLINAFIYYDPKLLLGGIWGSEVDVAINVIVLDGAFGIAVIEAFVFLDNDLSTVY